MPKPLDALREWIESEVDSIPPLSEAVNYDVGAYHALKDTLAYLDQFEAEHPGLVDQTLVCDTCHQPYKGPGWMRNHSTTQKVDIRIVCPACAKEATDA